eukprot:4070235-Amphidinium_carterae.1
MSGSAVHTCPHLGHVRLLSYGSVTFITHGLTGEGQRLDAGQWSLSFDEDGDGIVEGLVASGERHQLDVADILKRDLFETEQEGRIRRLIQVAGENGEWLDVAAARISSMRLALHDGQDEIILLVYTHTIPKSLCRHWLPLSRVIGRLFGVVPKGFTAKRLDAWSSRMRETFLMDEAFRTSWLADEQRRRLQTVSKYPEAQRAEEESSVSLLALPVLLAMFATSPHPSALIGQNTLGCRASSLLVALLATLPTALAWSMELHPPGTVISCTGSCCDLSNVSGGQDRSASHAWAHIVRLAGGTSPERTALSSLIILTARAIAMEKHTQAFKTTCKHILRATALAVHDMLSIRLSEVLVADVTGVPLITVNKRPVRVDAGIRAQVASASAGARH